MPRKGFVRAPAAKLARCFLHRFGWRNTRVQSRALRELQVKHEGLQRELRRKEKALAEAAALLVLQKKFNALWEGEEK